MIKIEFEAAELVNMFDAMNKKFEGFPEKMEEEFAAWQREDVNRQQPEVERPDRKSVGTTIKRRGRRKSAAERVAGRFRRRLMRRLTPKPIRMVRRYSRLGRRVLGGTLPPQFRPTPVRRFHRLLKQARGIGRGRPRAIGRVIRPYGAFLRATRRMAQRAELVNALTDRMGGLAGRNLTWR